MKRPLPLRLLLIALLATGGLVHAQAPAARTGDAWTDARLADINVYGATYRDAFVDELVRYHRAPRELVQDLLARPGWSPADVYLACGLALQSGRPCRSVVETYAKDPARGWATVAREVGVVPGSPAFHALKRSVVASYDRWARPLAIDAELAADFPGRPQEPSAPAKAGKDDAAPGKAPGAPAHPGG